MDSNVLINERRRDLLDGLAQARREGLFFDAEIVCAHEGDGDKKQVHVPAHQNVVSSASPFLKKLFEGTERNAVKGVHVIFIPDVSTKAMTMILDFIYEGQVVLADASDVAAFEAAAAKLEVVVSAVKEEDKPVAPKTKTVDLTQMYGSSVVRLEGGRAQCMACGKQLSTFSYAVRHYETQHEQAEMEFKCSICEATSKNEDALFQHLRRKHDIRRSAMKKKKKKKIVKEE